MLTAAFAIFITIVAMLILAVIGLKSMEAFMRDEESQDDEYMDYCSTRGLRPWE